MGMSKEYEAYLRSLPLSKYVNKIDAWLIDDQYVSHLAVLYEDGGSLKLGGCHQRRDAHFGHG